VLTKCFAGVLGVGLLLIVTLPVLFSGGDDSDPLDLCTSSTAAAVTAGPAEVPAILATIRERESSGNYQARADRSSASGAYQFTDGTWSDYGSYTHASDAPPAVQDAAASEHVARILAAHTNDPAAVPVVWYLGHLPAPDDPAWDTIPGAGNRLTPRQYQQAWIATYTELSAGTSANSGPPSPCPTPAAVDSASGELATAEGITVDAQPAPRLEQLIHDARAAGYQLTGSGYRSHERQIELRRQHCGTSHYAIHEMPSSQCTPPTARPGSSMHEQGLAIDFSCDGALIESPTTACYTWLADHAPALGLHNLPSEPWHWSTTGR
jgi:hypothetical protein